MAHPETPITWDGPVADLARELRRLRYRAGTPGYRLLAESALFSSTTLAAASGGRIRPSEAVALAFARACGADDGELKSIGDMWAAAYKAARAERARARALSDRGLIPRAARRRADKGKAGRGQPHPDPSGTAADLVRQLRALRAWTGQPGHKTISGRTRALGPLPRSTMYDALDPRRRSLPALEVVQCIVAGCAPEALEEWTEAWREIRLSELERMAPAPVVDAEIPAESA